MHKIVILPGAALFALLVVSCSSELSSMEGVSLESPHSIAPDEPQLPPTEPSQSPATNPFVAASADPFSTFAADVDTASYDLYRSVVINEQRLPLPAQVRVEEFINAFDYDYPAPDTEAEHPFLIDLAAAPDFLGSSRTLLRVGIQAQQPIAFEKRPTNLAFLVDVSGSMQDELKLPLVKRLLSETLTVLDPEDRVALVTYASGTQVALPSTAANSDKLALAIAGLTAGGSTNGAGGLELAYEEVSRHFVEGGINHVVLCTDGDFNVGPSSTSELVKLIEAKRTTGITLTVVGVGTMPNDGMMELLSGKGNGVYGIVGTEDQAVDYAQHRMLGSLQLVAKDLKIQVEFNPEHVHAYRLLGYENRSLLDEEFRDDAVDAGEVGAGHRVTALYELALSPKQLPAEAELHDASAVDESSAALAPSSELERTVAAQDLVAVRVRYKDLTASAEDAAYEVHSALAFDQIAPADADLRWAASVAKFAELLRGSPYAEASTLKALSQEVNAQSSRDVDRAEFVRLLDTAAPLLDAR